MPKALFRHALLCVEDDENDQRRLQAALAGYELVFAANAGEALRQWNSRSFDACVMEYWLPDWSGPSLCREMRKTDPHVPLLFYTDATRPHDEARALRAGASCFLVKGDVLQLAAKLRDLLLQADVANHEARAEEERAIAEEIERRVAAAAHSMSRADVLMNSALERVARAKAMSACFARRGTKAYFERAWPIVYGTARANAMLEEPEKANS